MLSLNCIAKVSVCRSYIAKIGNLEKSSQKNQELIINTTIKNHQKVLRLIKKVNSIYIDVNMVQVFTALGLMVIVFFQLQNEMGLFMILVLITLMVQLLSYCVIGEWISSEVRKKYITFIFHTLYSV